MSTSNKYDISYCTVAMNRADHVKDTLVENIGYNLSNNVEFLLLDYNSSDDLEEWVKSNMILHIQSGKLKYFKTTKPAFFDRSHSRNMVFKKAQGKYVCNVDADNFIGNGFTEYLLSVFKTNSKVYIGADLTGFYYTIKDAFGRFACEKEAFIAVGGYDEDLSGYGPEDKDLFARLELYGLKKVTIENIAFLKAISHSNDDRIGNEFLAKNLNKIYLLRESPILTKILLTLKTEEFYYLEIEPNKYESVIQANLIPHSFLSGKIDKLKREKGLKFIYHNQVELNVNGPIVLNEISNEEFRNKVLMDIPLFLNQDKMQSNLKQSRISVNENGLGEGELYMNFSLKPI